jgi:hypothetical protein
MMEIDFAFGLIIDRWIGGKVGIEHLPCHDTRIHALEALGFSFFFLDGYPPCCFPHISYMCMALLVELSRHIYKSRCFCLFCLFLD